MRSFDESVGSTIILSFQQTWTEHVWLEHCMLGSRRDRKVNEKSV